MGDSILNGCFKMNILGITAVFIVLVLDYRIKQHCVNVA